MKPEQLLMLESLDAVWREVSQNDSILIATHERPDGDALGSLAALHRVLVREGHTVQMASIETVPPGYEFMLPMLKSGDRTGKRPGLLIALDSERPDRLMLPSNVSAAEVGDLSIVNIDHHSTNTLYGMINLVVPTASSTAELVFHLLARNRKAIDKTVAECLLVGIIEDTGRFQFERTSADTLRVAASLVERGISINELVDLVNKSHSIASLHLWSDILATAQGEADGRIVWAYLSADMLAKHDMRTNPGDIVNMLMQVETCELAILFREQDKDSVRVSLRATDKVDATEIAKRFGGGGYPRTAGCVLRRPLSETMAEVLRVANQIVKQ